MNIFHTPTASVIALAVLLIAIGCLLRGEEGQRLGQTTRLPASKPPGESLGNPGSFPNPDVDRSWDSRVGMRAAGVSAQPGQLAAFRMPGTRSSPAASDGIAIDACVVMPFSTTRIPARLSGVVAEIGVRAGDQISRHQLLVRLDDTIDVTQIDAAQLRVDSAKQRALSDIGLQYATVTLEEAARELERWESIGNSASGAVADQRLQQLKLAHRRAGLALQNAKEQRQQSDLDWRAAKSELNALNQQRSLTRIHAGDAGLVDTVLKQPGEWVDQGETILTLLDLRRVRISGIASQQQVSPADCLLAQLIVDRDARSADNPDQVVPMRGHVTHIDAKRLPGGRFRFHAIVDNVVLQSKSQNASTRPGAAPQWALMPGQSVRVRLVTPPVGRVTDVPRLNRR